MNPWDIVALAIGLGLVILPQTWRFVTHAITLVHELGHALIGLLSGAQVSSIKINRDSSGVTTSAHPLKNILITRTFTTFWGYPFPTLFAGALIAISCTVDVRWAWWAVLALGVICLFFIRNLFGLMITAIWVGTSALLLWKGVEANILQSLLWGLIALLYFGGVRDFWNLTKIYKRGKDEGSDINALREITHIPAIVWLALMWITGCGIIPYILWWTLLR